MGFFDASLRRSTGTLRVAGQTAEELEGETKRLHRETERLPGETKRYET